MLRSLSFLNYRSHRNTRIELEPLTVFIGPVAAGKSNIFRGLVMLQNAVNSPPPELFGAGPFAFWAQRYRAVESSTASIGFGAELTDLPGFAAVRAQYEIEVAVGRDGEDDIYIARERLARYRVDEGDPGEVLFSRDPQRRGCPPFGRFDPKDGSVLGYARRLPGADQSEHVRFTIAVAENLSRYGFYHLEAGDLRRTSSTNSQPRRVDYNGRDLPGALRFLRENAPDAFREIEVEMRELIPGLQELRLTPVAADQLGIGLKHEGHESHLTSLDASDGTLFTLGLLSILKQPELPAVLALEEPETGLHPGRLRWLVDKLWDVSHPTDGRPATQVLLSTHSPCMLDILADVPETIRIVEMKDGASRVCGLLNVMKDRGMDWEALRADSLGRQWYAGVFEDGF